VAFPIRPKAGLQLETDTPRAAGLCAWVGEKNHVGVGRVEEPTAKGGQEAFHMLYTHPKGVRTTRAGADRPNGAAVLRLRRDGRKVTTWYNRDGKEWTGLSSEEVQWPAVVRVGVYAKNVSGEAFTATFDQYALTQPKKK
jgi:hypothetical protein